MNSLIDEDLAVEDDVPIPMRMSVDDFLGTVTMDEDLEVAGELDDSELFDSVRAKRNIIDVTDSDEDEGEVIQSIKERPKLEDVLEAINTVRQYVQQLGKDDKISLGKVENILQVEVIEGKKQTSIEDFLS